jgi:hypothetical protein
VATSRQDSHVKRTLSNYLSAPNLLKSLRPDSHAKMDADIVSFAVLVFFALNGVAQ